MRVRVRVEGTVQGVGFRPFVYRLAKQERLAGFVGNDERGVVLEVEGASGAVERFLRRLQGEAPPLASVESVLAAECPPAGERDFRIVASHSAGDPDALVSPDTATCEDCLAELFDPGDRRHRYPFINCTNCGPRFTIVRGVPYDRPLTTMAGFAMCERCRGEYEDPADRRFHAQPNACPECGPSLRPSLELAVLALQTGRIVAVKGLGGYHLACLASDEEAVAALRARKHREDRPFALMARDLEAARELVELTADDEALLVSPARPIVIARAVGEVAPSVAPRHAELGVMLPYSPLHHLLLADVGEPLVMTSGNVSDEPIAYEDDDAQARLHGIADLLLSHDRPIHTRTDDSVVRAGVLIRRSRGYVPASTALPIAAERHVLACGAELKSTFCLARGARAWVGHHIGDLQNYETLAAFQAGVEHFEALFAVRPELVAHDLHPDYLSTTYALAREGVEHLAVQHHHAHLAAALAEHGLTGPAVGAIYDGAGLGDDRTVWGGELLVGGLDGYERAGHLWPVRLPGGDRAAREPWRMACAWLGAAEVESPPLVDAALWDRIAEISRTGLASPWTTSMGRLFDAVAALCRVRLEATYEGQAAAELEARAGPSAEPYPLPVIDAPRVIDGRSTPRVLDARETIGAVTCDVAAGVDAATVSARFHAAVAQATAEATAAIAEERGLDTVVLSGGVFQNRRLLEETSGRLEGRGLRALVPRQLPPNDGGIAYGQAAIAASISSTQARA